MTDIRQAAIPQPAPTGEGAVVLEFVQHKLAGMVELSKLPHAVKPIVDIEGVGFLQADLAARAEFGKAKYGTYLRTNNGRNALVDLYQEVQDAIMYSAQLRLEGDAAGANGLEVLVAIGAQLASLINQRAA